MKFLFFLLLGARASVQATEPTWCDPNTFSRYQIPAPPSLSLPRLHLYKIGSVTLAGLAIGKSRASDVVALAENQSQVAGADRYCTWYLNDENNAAQQTFNYFPMAYPNDYSSADAAAADYGRVLAPVFSQNSTSFVGCAERFAYIAMGCDGMMHRGPSVFAMFLAYSGCSAEHAAQVANNIWGLNGIRAVNRLAIAQKGYELGEADHEGRRRLQQKLSNP